MELVTTLADIKMPSEMRKILASRQTQLKEERQMAQQASMAESEAADSAQPAANTDVEPQSSESDAAHTPMQHEEEEDRDLTVTDSDPAHSPHAVDGSAESSQQQSEESQTAEHAASNDNSGTTGMSRGSASGVHADRSNGASSNGSSPQPVQTDLPQGAHLLKANKDRRPAGVIHAVQGKEDCCVVPAVQLQAMNWYERFGVCESLCD